MQDRSAASNLFLVSFGLLVFELACIRWLPSNLRALSFFSNFVLLSCFLGMSLGLLRTGKGRLLAWTLPLLLAGMALVSRLDLGLSLQEDPDSIFFGADLIVQDGLAVPFWAVLTPVFVATAALFAGPGQEMGLQLRKLPPLQGYTINVAGSIAGILAFMAASHFSLPPACWFGVAGLSFVWVLRDRRGAMLVSLAALAVTLVLLVRLEGDNMWSPYNRITLQPQGSEIHLMVNGLAHQTMRSHTDPGTPPAYHLPHIVLKGASQGPPARMLIIGAGTGTDVSFALLHGAAHIDAVDIDPTILDLGRRMHPDRPYQDPRVTAYVDDGRAFLRRSTEKYDVISYAVVDSLTLLSQFGSVRLENYLFTEEALRDVRARLADDGVFVAYNQYRQPWLVARLYRLLQKVFGEDRVVVMLLPGQEVLSEGMAHGDTSAMFFAGNIDRVRELLAGRHVSIGVRKADGTSEAMALFPVERLEGLESRLTSDDWPFTYVRWPAVPPQNVMGVLLVAGLSVVLLALGGGLTPGRVQGHFLFLGAAFMLLETRGIARLALLFGSTWVSNSFTFLAILVLILAANLAAPRVRWSTRALYLGLGSWLLLDLAVPLSGLLFLPAEARAVVGCLLLFGPVFFAGLLFARSFSASTQPAADLGSNILGAMIGGCLENLCLVVGYGGLVWLVAGLYALSWLTMRRPSALSPTN